MFSVRQKILNLTFAAVVFLLGGSLSPLVADEVIRIMAGNLSSGNLQSYDPGEGNRIFQGLDPDIALVQEMNVGVSPNKNTAATYRSWVDANFGTTFSYFCQTGSGIQIPNGIISRYPIAASGVWDDTTMTNRDYAWARINIPGDKDLWAVSVHISSGGGSSQRDEEATEIKNYILSNVPTGDYLVIGGDFNTTSRTEACITTLSSVVVTAGPWPVDQAGDGDTNSGRNDPYDWVIPDADLAVRKTPLVIGANSFTNGLVFDSRKYSPLTDVVPVVSTDSDATGMQHMGVIRAFLIPTNTAPLIATAATSSSTETVTDPDSSVYKIVRGTTTGLSVLATDDGGEAALKYTWILTSGPGSSVAFSANGTNAAKNCTATFSALGNYTLTATAQDVAGLSVSSSVKIRVVQAAGSLALSPPAATLAVGAPQAFSASLLDQFGQAMSGQPPFSWLVNGGGSVSASGVFTATTAGGPYVITASGSGFSKTSGITVTRGVAAVSLGGLTQTYNGSPKTATATTTPSGLAVTLLYNGSAAAPTNAGSYAVTATISDANYTGSTSGTLVIQKASVVLQIAGLATTYDGSPKPVSITPSTIAVAVLYNGSASAPTNAGSYPVTVSVTDPNYTGSVSGTLVIQKAAASIQLSDLTATYDGSPKSALATTTPSGLAVTIHYDDSPTSPISVGSYAVTASITDANHIGGTTGTLVINKAEAELELTGLAATYDGTPKTVTASSTPSSLAVSILYDGSPTPPVNAGSYQVTASVVDANYQGVSSSTLIIASDEWALWKNSHFNIQEQTEGLAADSADPEADGRCNLIEYALGSDPRQFTAPIPGVMDDVGFSLTFTRPAALPGIHYAVEASSDFSVWTPVPLEILETGAVETVRGREPIGPDPSAPRFLRLRVSRD